MKNYSLLVINFWPLDGSLLSFKGQSMVIQLLNFWVSSALIIDRGVKTL